MTAAATAAATATEVASAAGTATAGTGAGADAGASGPPEAASASTVASGPPAAHFPAAAAKQALEAAAHEVRSCKRGKVWGIGSANVTFASDGTVSHVAVSVPFTGTPTAQCVADAFASVKVQPFAGKAPVTTVRFFVAAK
jgi:hypothetical protein